MTLLARYQERYSTQSASNMSNPDNAAAAAADAARLGFAAQDAEAEFQRLAGVLYNEADDEIVDLAVEGVRLKLMERGTVTVGNTDKRRTAWEKKCEFYRITKGANAPILPKTTGVAIPSDEQVNNRSPRPKFDDPKFDDMIPDDPSSGLRSVDDPITP